MAIVCVIGDVLNEQYGPIYKKEKDKNKRNNRNSTPTTSCNPTYIQTSQGSQNNKQNNNAKRKRNEIPMPQEFKHVFFMSGSWSYQKELPQTQGKEGQCISFGQIECS